MRRRQPLPRLWLMTDERMGDGLWAALRALPRGAGVVFRHHGTPTAERRRLFERVRAEARRRGVVVILAGSAAQAAGWRADGVHGRSAKRARRGGVRTWAAHDAREAVAGVRAGAAVVFLSPAFDTRSHPGGRVLGMVRFGMAAGHFRRVRPFPSAHGGARVLLGSGSEGPHRSIGCGQSSALEASGKGAPRPLLIALGGVDAHRFRRLRPLGADGWAGIDAWATDQKRKVVPK